MSEEHFKTLQRAKGTAKQAAVVVAAAVIGAAAQAQFESSWSLWAKIVTLTAASAIAIVTAGLLLRWVVQSLKAKRRSRMQDSAIRGDVIFAGTSLAEMCGQGFTLGVGSVLHPLHEVGQLPPDAAQYIWALLSTIGATSRDLIDDIQLGHLRPTAALRRIANLQRAYIRICVEVSRKVNLANQPSVQRDWEAIRDRANLVSNHLVRVSNSSEAFPREYFEHVPSA